VQAPAAAAPAATSSFGAIGFTAKAKPAPRPVIRPAAPTPVVVERPQAAEESGAEPSPQEPAPRAAQVASRTVERTPVAPAPARPASGGVLEIAARYEGIMYRYGGTTPETGFDCSGFTQYVFRQVGISLPRTAEEQRQFVTPVSSPQPGDLVFFGAPAYHMGIYAGNGMMWDSPRSGKAVALRSVWTSDVTYGRP
jgi:peptidoglycan DL-endopeptidase CwlO